MTFKMVGFARFLAGITAGLALLLAPAMAQAALIIQFDDVQLQGGTLTGTTGANNTDVVGTDIIFDQITLLDVSDLSNPLAAVQCGSATSTGTATLADACHLSFDGSTGLFTILAPGGLYDAGADSEPYTGDEPGTLVLAAGGTVLQGTLSSWFLGNTGFIGDGTDVKNQALLDFFGVTADGFSFTETNIKTLGTGPNNVRNSDLSNVPDNGGITQVPEPGTLALLGLGIAGLGRSRLRARRA